MTADPWTLERFDLGEIPYAEAIREMAEWVRLRQAGAIGDRLVLLTHPPVITYGARTPAHELPSGGSIPLVAVDRGGQATYHGPGQLIGYLVAKVRGRGPVDVVRWMEHGLIDALGALDVPAVRRDTPPGAQSLVGVWTPEGRKIASIGMRIRGGVTSHGFALNITTDLRAFEGFTGCGLPDADMTSLQEIAERTGGRTPSHEQVRDAVAEALDAHSPAIPATSR